MSHPFEDWLHNPDQPLPSYHEMASWLFARQRSLDEAIASGSVAYIRAELSVITTGLMMYESAKHRDLSNVETIWRVEVSFDDGRTWEEFAQYHERRDKYAEAVARTKAELLDPLGRVVKVTRYYVEDSEVMS